ncbi:hypothetical protein [Ponticaulis profundi]|uniref:Uncharacterized protein n=1 Tax=Ponticaulis profundi TaxID=2665222 RepID=A0ABW1SE11_9PROT
MTNDELKAAIRAMIAAHPNLEPSADGHNKHMERYITANGTLLGLEPDLKSKVNLFVERRSVPLRDLSDIPHKEYFAANYATSKPNHDLFGPCSFKLDMDLISFFITDLWSAARVIRSVAGEGAGS